MELLNIQNDLPVMTRHDQDEFLVDEDSSLKATETARGGFHDSRREQAGQPQLFRHSFRASIGVPRAPMVNVTPSSAAAAASHSILGCGHTQTASMPQVTTQRASPHDRVAVESFSSIYSSTVVMLHTCTLRRG